MTTTTTRLKTLAADALRAYLASTDEDRTEHLRTAANALVDAREHFYTADGTPDWRGRSYAYRRFVGDVYAEAAVPREDLATVQAAIRYHIGNALRERLSPDELEALGLRPVGPRDRSVEKRSAQAALLSQISGGPIETPDDFLAALNTLQRIIARLGEQPTMTPAERREAKKSLHEAQEALAGLEVAPARRR